jgi:hypothetical protein
MRQTIESALEVREEPSAQASFEARVAAGRVPWAGPLIVILARPLLMIASQGLVALILAAMHRPDQWRLAGYWWTIYGTIVDIGCLSAMFRFTRREGIRMRDLLGTVWLPYGKDIFLGLGYFALVFSALSAESSFPSSSTAHQAQTQGLTSCNRMPCPCGLVVYGLSLW